MIKTDRSASKAPFQRYFPQIAMNFTELNFMMNQHFKKMSYLPDIPLTVSLYIYVLRKFLKISVKSKKDPRI